MAFSRHSAAWIVSLLCAPPLALGAPEVLALLARLAILQILLLAVELLGFSKPLILLPAHIGTPCNSLKVSKCL